MNFRKVLVGSLISLACFTAQAQEKENDLVIGLHLGSYHDAGNFNNVNPGIYVRKNNFVVGDYYNSEKRNSFYFGYLLEAKTPKVPLLDSVAVIVGGITGYRKDTQIAGFTPMFIPSAKFLVTDDFGFRLAFIPRISDLNPANVYHLSVEKSF